MPTMAANGLRIHYELTGPEAGPSLVFVNALGGTVAMWREQLAALSRHYRCVAFDANGHGTTSAKAMRPAIDALAEDLAALLDGLAIQRAHIVGASIGGMTALAFAAANPARVDRLVLLGTTPKMPDPSPWISRAAEARRDGLAAIGAAAMTRWFTERFRVENAARVDETHKAFVACDREAYALACEAIGAMDLRPMLGSIGAPTLVMAAADDPGTPLAAAETLRAGIPAATLVIVPRAAHLMMIERHRDVSAWIGAFLGLRGDGAEA